MFCEICGINEAVFHLKQMIGKDKIELHLCENCAKLKGIQRQSSDLEFSIAQLLNTLIDPASAKTKKPSEIEKCPRCGQPAFNINRYGKAGCQECFLVFVKDVREYLKGLYGRVCHKGKLPQKIKNLKDSLEDLSFLKTKLKEAIEVEDYELAASLRDRINELALRVKKNEAGN